jgi:uncharacterized protein YceH (UPF0502 family)
MFARCLGRTIGRVKIELTSNEARVLGCLMEKSVVTPDLYPLTLNSLTNACNQKTSRDPVLSLDPGVAQHTARALEAKHLVSREENFRSGVEKYTQRLCNTPFSEFQFDQAEFAVMCLLLLRGRQTPGELRARSGRLCVFEDNNEVATTLQGLMDRDGGPLVARLPRTPGRLDSEYMHLFYGAIESAPAEVVKTGVNAPAGSRPDRIVELEARVSVLEQELMQLKQLLEE